VIELDRDLAAHWRTHSQVQVIESDVLKVPLVGIKSAQIAIKSIAIDAEAKMRLVGNLPYNISTPILFHLLPYAHLVQDQHFMLQKEVIDRMVAEPSTADYGRLSVMLQWRYAMENFLHVPPQAFDPPPRVQSAVVRMIPHAEPAALNAKLLEELVQVAFSQRRKLLRHSLGRWLEEKKFAGDFDVQRRAEEVPVAQYVALAQQMTQ
jgi:16S rRNA (adenine1518-N6/adenine1519-N6)-dimethyltransferase